MTSTPAEREAFLAAERARIIDEVARRIAAGRQQPPAVCEDCGELGELRPYGPGGTNVCFPCGMKDEEEAKRQFFKSLGVSP